MKNWINKNYKTLIIAAFLVPIITVAIVSISHVTIWYGISNPVTWAVYLSIGIEIAALSALAAISANMGSKVYFPFAIVTLVQFIGNIFFAYSYIDVDSKSFKDWVDLVSPLVEYLGVESTDFVGHKRFLAFFAGGMLPVISLSFLHMLVKFSEEDRKRQQEKPIEEKIEEEKINTVEASDIVSEVSRLRLSEEDLKKLEEVLLNPPPPNEALVRAAEKYKETKKEQSTINDDEILKRAEEIQLKRVFEESKKIKEQREEEFGPDNIEDEPTALANSEYREADIEEDYNDWGGLSNEELIGDDEIPYIPQETPTPSTTPTPVEEIQPIQYPTQEERARLLSEMMRMDQELGLYNEPTPTPTPTETFVEPESKEFFINVNLDSFENKPDFNVDVKVDSDNNPPVEEEISTFSVEVPQETPIAPEEVVEKKNP